MEEEPGAERPTKPFIKAAGGKSKLLGEILSRAPAFEGLYHEPFLGGGVVFLGLERRAPRAGTWATLGDANPDLVNAYAEIQRDAPGIIERLQELKRRHSKESYYAVRGKEEPEPAARAARFVYLNKTCFNGLYRVNAKGKFNVPMGRYKNPGIVEPEVLLGWQRILQGATLHARDFERAISDASSADFIYCDPPYLPRSKSADFTSYTAEKFTLKDHERLAASLAEASERGAFFLCSQGDSDAIRALYKGFNIAAVTARHSVGARAASRVKVDEVLISNCA